VLDQSFFRGQLYLLLLKVLKKQIYLLHLVIIKADCPKQPVEMLFELQVLPRNHQAIKGSWLHIGQPSLHFYLFLHPVPVSQIQNFYH
jgi:hypothetical protein